MTKAIIILSLFLCSVQVYANTCGNFFYSKKTQVEDRSYIKELFKIIPSGRDSDVIPIYQEFVEKLYEHGGVLDQLGIPKNPQIVEFMKGQDLNAVAKAGTGGFPVSHYLDGAEIVKAYQDMRSLIFEVVYPGPDAQHAFYRDDNPVQSQLSIILHVIGHNHFAGKSLFKGYRVDLGPRVSKQLDALINRLYETENKDEVQRWYLFLKSLLPYQDFYTGNYQYTSQFEPKTPHQTYPDYTRRVQLGQNLQERHPLAATENVLQAVAANIPPHAPAWKKQMAEMMVKLVSFQTALVHTQVMNEGWATFMQQLLIKHMEQFNTFEYWVKAVKLMNVEAEPQLRDPYWLGVNGWRRLYEKFNERPEIKALPTLVERDRKFIEYAQENFITRVDDFEFLRASLDDTWISRNNLAIARRAQNHEVDWNQLPPPPPGQQNPAPWIISTRDAKRVVEHIIRSSVYGKFRFRPRLKLNDFTRSGSGDVELVLDDQVGRIIPLQKNTIAPTLYTFAQLLEKPVSLEATLSEKKQINADLPSISGWGPFGGMASAGGRGMQTQDVAFRARIVVSPNGEVKVYRIKNGEIDSKVSEESDVVIATSKKDGEVFDEALTDYHGRVINRYLLDVYLEDNVKLDELIENNIQFKEIAQQMVDRVIDSADVHSMIDHAPSAAKALVELKAMLERRTLKALERSMTKGGGLRIAGNRLFLKALPDTPMLSFESSFIERMFEDNSEIQPFFSRGAFFRTENRIAVEKDERGDSTVTPIDGGDGKIVWGPGKPRNGNGSGEEPGEPGDKPSPGPKPGDVPQDPTWIEIPVDLYAKFIGERIKLPHLRPKKGPSKLQSKSMRSRQNMRDGIVLEEDTLLNVLSKGFGAESSKGNDPTRNIDDTLEAGFTYIEPARDIVVKRAKPKPKPNINAVVTFVIDGSGSTASFFQVYKRFVFDLKALISNNYKGVQYRFVFFDTAAHEVKEAEFFKIALGGGTSYVAGLNKVEEIQEANYPRDQWDRFVFVFGDLEDVAPPTLQKLREVSEQTEFVGVVRGAEYDFMNELRDGVRQASEESPYVGFLDLGNRKEIDIADYRLLLKNEEE